MMKGFLIFVKRLWTKNIGSNIAVTVMIFLTCCMTALVFNRIYRFYYEYNFFKDTPLNSSLFFMGREGNMEEEDEEGHIYSAIDTGLRDELISYGEEKGVIGGIARLMDFYDKNSMCSVWIYDEITASYLGKGVVGSGKWLFEDEMTGEGYYPVVIHKGLHYVVDEDGEPDPETGVLPTEYVMMGSDEFNIGDVLDLDISMSISSHPLEGKVPSKDVKVKAEIVGTAEENTPFRFMPCGQWGTIVQTVRETFADEMINDNAIIFFPYDEELFKGYEFPYNTVLIYFNEDASKESIEDFYTYARGLGYCNLGSDILNETKAAADDHFKQSFFLIYMFMGLTLISIICISFLNVKKVRKIFSIYYLNGCSFIKSLGIYFTYFISMYGLSFLLFLAAMGIQQTLILNTHNPRYNIDDAQLYTIDPQVALAAVLVGVVVSIISTAVPFLIMKRRTVIQNLKET